MFLILWEGLDDGTIFKVVINNEEQYLIWPVDRENELGWHDVGKEGSKQDCLDYIEEVWTDMRPLSLRRKMFADAVREKFGSLPDEIKGRIETSDGTLLRLWEDRLDRAKSVDEL